MTVGVLAALLAGTASAGCFDRVTERLNKEPLELDFTAKSSDEVAFGFLSEWTKAYRPCLPLDFGDFRMFDLVPTRDRGVVYVFEYTGKEELMPDGSARREIWLSMQRTYCEGEMLPSRGVKLVYSIRDHLGSEVLRVELPPGTCKVQQALVRQGAPKVAL